MGRKELCGLPEESGTQGRGSGGTGELGVVRAEWVIKIPRGTRCTRERGLNGERWPG